MPTTLLKISGGTVYDPANGIDGQVRDLWIDGGRIVAAPSDPNTKPAQTLDAAGLVVMPGGVDMHCHIVGPKVNAARRMRPEEKRSAEPVLRTATTRSGTLGSTPSTAATGYKYAGLGYTTAFDAAVAPLAARHAHLEFADTPCIDRGCFILMGNNHYLMQAIRRNEPRACGRSLPGCCERRAALRRSWSIRAASKLGKVAMPQAQPISTTRSTASRSRRGKSFARWRKPPAN